MQSGTTGEKWATENLKPHGATIVPFKDTTGAFNALQAKTVDAVVNDLPVTAEIIKEGPTRGFIDHRRDPDGRAVRHRHRQGPPGAAQGHQRRAGQDQG